MSGEELSDQDIFLHRLALALGRTVDELLDSISYPELVRWGKYYALEPFGEWPANMRAAQIVATLANINRDSKKRSRPYEIQEFELFRRKPKRKKERTTEEILEEIEAGDEPSHMNPKQETDAKIDPHLVHWLFWKSRQSDSGNT